MVCMSGSRLDFKLGGTTDDDEKDTVDDDSEEASICGADEVDSSDCTGSRATTLGASVLMEGILELATTEADIVIAGAGATEARACCNDLQCGARMAAVEVAASNLSDVALSPSTNMWITVAADN